MLNRGLVLSGLNTNIVLGASPQASGIAKVEGNVQVIETKLNSGRYSPIIVQKGIPVKWTISASQSDLNGCNEKINIPEYGIENKQLVSGDNIIEFTPDKSGNYIYTCWMGMISSNIKVVDDISAVSSSDIAAAENSGSQAPVGGLGGSCCTVGSKATKFAGGKIPTDDIQIAKIIDDSQQVTITVDDYGYSPAVVVMQKGMLGKITFKTDKLNSCNDIVVFPEYGAQLDLQSQKETPPINVEKDFTFQCGMGMLHGYVKVVDDINKVDLNAIRKEVQNYKPAAGAVGGGCCGG
jgi:plastocyanin domain-containing protein